MTDKTENVQNNAKKLDIIPMTMVNKTDDWYGISDWSISVKQTFSHPLTWHKIECRGAWDDDFSYEQIALYFKGFIGDVSWGFADNMYKGDLVKIYFDGRKATKKAVAYSTKNKFYMPHLPYSESDINNFAHRFFPNLEQRVAFNMDLSQELLRHGVKPHVSVADNLKEYLKFTNHAECVRNLRNIQR